jgi:hypothetical protein
VVAFRRLRGPAPDDVDFRTCAAARAGAAAAEAAIGHLSLPTFDHDSGRLSAAFGRDLLQRLRLAGWPMAPQRRVGSTGSACSRPRVERLARVGEQGAPAQEAGRP